MRKRVQKYATCSKPPTNWMKPFPRYWMSEEIFMHDNRKVFPDWGSLVDRYMEAKKRDRKAAYSKRREKIIIQKREYRQRPEVKKRNNQRHKDKIKSNPAFAIRHNLSRRLAEIMSGTGTTKGASILKFVGCSESQLKTHIESLFTKGIDWSNYGTHWHVDHILPCASFDHTDPKQVAQCWHWTNLRPLCAKENIAKSDKITNPQLSLLLCATH